MFCVLCCFFSVFYFFFPGILASPVDLCPAWQYFYVPLRSRVLVNWSAPIYCHRDVDSDDETSDSAASEHFEDLAYSPLSSVPDSDSNPSI